MVGYTADDNIHQERKNEQKNVQMETKTISKTKTARTIKQLYLYRTVLVNTWLPGVIVLFALFIQCEHVDFFLLSLAWMNVMTWRASWWYSRCALHTDKLASVSKQLKEMGLCNKLTVSLLVFFFCSFGRPNPFENFPHNNFIHWHSLEYRSIVN